ncbi:Conserved_hypothetical protein [Hexamita inflata]|uniref:Uncharacterized protein n=1 Tax=Hexamita inflata TaxID=28002 RepID=A0AA86RKY7_9EUKA|nr:Conserved hypothetical protein [Hexamita inflata]
MIHILQYIQQTIENQHEQLVESDILTQINYESCNNVVFKANILMQYCFKQQSLVNSAITKNFKFVQAVNLNSQHNVFQSVQRIQNIVISSSIVHNQSAQTSFSTFGLSSIPRISQVSIDVDLQSRYKVVAFLVRSQNKLNISYSTFNFSCVYSDNVSSILAIEDSLSLLHVDMYLYYIGQYVSGLVMSSFASTQILLNQSNIYGSMNGSVLTSQITAFGGTNDIQILSGKICTSMPQNCPSCFFQPMTSCCREDAEIIPNNNFYSCACIDPLRTALDPHNPISTTCVCIENYFAFNIQCVKCPTDSFSKINSNICTCINNYQVHSLDLNQCICVPKYSSKINGTCTCLFPGSDISSSSCFCQKGLTLVTGQDVMCICEANKYINNSICIACPIDAISSINASQCTCAKEYQIHNKISNKCECQPTYSTKQANGSCTCPTGSVINSITCTCFNSYIMQGTPASCACGLNYYLNNSQCIACPIDGYTSAINSQKCTCNQANQAHNTQSNQCSCTPLYSSKLENGICTCFDGAIIQGNTCVCINNFLINTSQPYSCYCSTNMRSGQNKDQCVRSGRD